MAEIKSVMGVDAIVTDYFCSTRTEIQAAIDETGNGSCVIYLVGGTIDFAGVTVDIDGGGSYIIRGGGDSTIIDSGDGNVFDVSNAKSIIFQDFKVDCTDFTVLATYVFYLHDTTNHPKTLIHNINIIGDYSNGFGVFFNTKYVTVTNCWFEAINKALDDGNDYCTIIGNYFYNCGSHVVYLRGSSHTVIKNNNIWADVTGGRFSSGIVLNDSSYCVVSGNIVTYFLNRGIRVYASSYRCTVTGNVVYDGDINSSGRGSGIEIDIDGDYNIVFGNVIYNIQNSSTGTAYGINIDQSDCNENTIVGNLIKTYKSGGIYDAAPDNYKASNLV